MKQITVMMAFLAIGSTSLNVVAAPLMPRTDLVVPEKDEKTEPALRSRLSKEQQDEFTAIERITLQKDLADLAKVHGGDHDSFATKINSELGPVDLVAASRTLLNSSKVLNEYSKNGIILEPSAAALKSAIEESNQVMAEFVLVMPKKIFDPDSEEGKIVGNLILRGLSIARGDVSRTMIYTNLAKFKDVIRKIQSGEAMTAEQAVQQVSYLAPSSHQNVSKSLKNSENVETFQELGSLWAYDKAVGEMHQTHYVDIDVLQSFDQFCKEMQMPAKDAFKILIDTMVLGHKNRVPEFTYQSTADGRRYPMENRMLRTSLWLMRQRGMLDEVFRRAAKYQHEHAQILKTDVRKYSNYGPLGKDNPNVETKTYLEVPSFEQVVVALSLLGDGAAKPPQSPATFKYSTVRLENNSGIIWGE